MGRKARPKTLKARTVWLEKSEWDRIPGNKTQFVSESVREKLSKGKSKSDEQIEAIKQLLNK